LVYQLALPLYNERKANDYRHERKANDYHHDINLSRDTCDMAETEGGEKQRD